MQLVSKENQYSINLPSYLPKPSTIQGKIPFHSIRSYPSDFIKLGSYKYRQKDIIGKGFSSKVYKGYHIYDQTKVCAIKIIDMKKFKSSSLKLVENEISIHRNLNHPNIVRCYDVYKTEEYCYIVTEYCAEGDLNTFLKQQKKVEESLATQIIKQIIQGYKYLVKNNILHRDLKPANIFQSGDVWKIGDFGFACRDYSIADRFNVGTPLYMPLQSLTNNKYSNKTDIFAIGILAYELVVGKTPWEAKNQKQLIEKMKTIPIKIPKLIKGGKLQKIITKACQINEVFRMGKQQLFQLFSEQKLFKSSHQLELKQKKVEKFKTSTNTPKTKSYAPVFMKISEGLNPEDLHPTHTSTPKKPIACLKYKMEASTEVSENDSKIQFDGMFKKNTQKIKGELELCRLVYFMIKNIDCFAIPDDEKLNNLKLILFKYLLRTIRELEDRKNNNFGLKCWQVYKNTQEYWKLQLEIKQQCAKYQREYFNFLKSIEIVHVRNINRIFPELINGTIAFSSEFFKKYLAYICETLRLMNHEIMKKYNNTEGYIHILTHHIQALDSFYTYYLIVRDKQIGKDYKIVKKVVEDYRKNTITKDKYFQLRGKLRFL